MATRELKKSLRICLAISTQYRRVTDGQTDRRTRRDVALEWLRSYLSGRYYTVRHGGSESSKRSTPFGTEQNRTDFICQMN